MAEQGELAFVKSFVNALSSQPVVYDNDYQPSPDNELKKVPVLAIDVPPPPARSLPVATSSDALSITFKSTKPAQSYTLDVQPTDTIAQIKAQLAGVAGAPPVDQQRLLLKGKVLADAKLLREYAVKDGDTINLMVKPGFIWDPSNVPASAATVAEEKKGEDITLLPSPEPKRGHSRIPSVVLSPSPSLTPSPGEVLVDIPLVLDTSSIPLSPATVSDSSYHAHISRPEFWEKLSFFLKSEFSNPADASQAWEDFFLTSKGHLSVSEIAKIRDAVGVIGMAGT
ncbi:ubiquitin-domain-containing protein [Epithele typhae]|uniref:ubiquitin-domain-containing protein n=1 Tax=Epithele typhae TaxID=378194 RepID=UPI002007ED3F|nr:ubiquitin-domain-containing protein [Epithele typhae]KAH9941891.1 ubiquitin-domain-containing protein [Epithele typhae]